MNKKAILLLSIEMTRRCNLNCDFCSRGDSQNIDISNSVIDKLIEEINDTYIHMLQIYGGEPTLTPEKFDYLVNQIIDNNIQIGYVIFYTNGIVKDKRFLMSLKKLLEYLKTISNDIKYYMDFFNRKSKKTYKYDDTNNVAVIVADYRHNNKKHLESAMSFYNTIKAENYKVILQSKILPLSFDGTLLLEGNAEKNYAKLITDKVSLFMREDNKTRVWSTCNESFVMEDFYNEDKNIGKTIFSTLCVSANGNVHLKPGTSYKNVDDNPMLQIMDCKKDFFERIEEWCWEHPLLPNLTYIKELCKTVKFCYENKIEITEDIEKEYSEIITKTDPSLTMIEKYNKHYHFMHPELSILEIQEMTNKKIIETRNKKLF